jgi:hypothetical protein
MPTTVKVMGGTFKISTFSKQEPFIDGTTRVSIYGAQMDLRFTPTKDLDATEVHLVQTIKDYYTDKTAYLSLKQQNLGFLDRLVASGTYEGIGIDMEFMSPIDAHLKRIVADRSSWLTSAIRTESNSIVESVLRAQQDVDEVIKAKTPKFGNGKNPGVVTSIDPRYAQQRLSGHVKPYATEASSGTAGWAAVRGSLSADWSPAAAALRDAPATTGGGSVAGMDFEVAALAEGGTMGARFVGSVSWGWRIDKSSVALYGLTKSSDDQASDAFFAASAHFNSMTLPSQASALPRMTLPSKVSSGELSERGYAPFEMDEGAGTSGRWERRGGMLILHDV